MTVLRDMKGQALPPIEAPSAETLRAYGDAMFLAFRSGRHVTMPVAMLRAALEPPLVLGQYRIFRFDDVPRGMFTWARLSEEAERRYVAGGQLAPEDWRSGERLWLIDIIAPYRGVAAGIARWVMKSGNVTDADFRFRRVEGARDTRRIVEVDFRRPRKARILTPADFGVTG